MTKDKADTCKSKKKFTLGTYTCQGKAGHEGTHFSNNLGNNFLWPNRGKKQEAPPKPESLRSSLVFMKRTVLTLQDKEENSWRGHKHYYRALRIRTALTRIELSILKALEVCD